MKVITGRKKIRLKRTDFNGSDLVKKLKVRSIYRSRSGDDPMTYAYIIINGLPMGHPIIENYNHSFERGVIGITGAGDFIPLNEDSDDSWFCEWEHCPKAQLMLHVFPNE